MSAADAGERYINDAQQRLMRVIEALAGHEVMGLANHEIAKAVGASQPVIVRDLANLQACGWAERVPETQRWRLAPPVVQISTKHAVALDRAQRKLDDTRNRFSRA